MSARLLAESVGTLLTVFSPCSVCRDHKLLRDLGTPSRNHLKFKENSSHSTTTSTKAQKKVSIVGQGRPHFRSKVSASSVSQMPSQGTDTAGPATQKPSVQAYKRYSMYSLLLSSGEVVIKVVLLACSNLQTGMCLWRCRLVRDIVGKSHRAITEESVKAKLTLPSIYSRREFNWMPRGRFDSILNGARAAMEWLKQGANWEDAKLKCAQDQVVAIHAEEVNAAAFYLDQAIHLTVGFIIGKFNRTHVVYEGKYVLELPRKKNTQNVNPEMLESSSIEYKFVKHFR